MAVASILADGTTSLEAGSIPTLNMKQFSTTAADMTEPLNLTCDWTDFMDEMDAGSFAMVLYHFFALHLSALTP